MKTISIGVNLFGDTDRQRLCIESLQILKNMYTPFIQLYCIQYADDIITTPNHFLRINELKRSSLDISPVEPKKPYINDMFNILSEFKTDYFIFLNSDILLTKRLIEYVIHSDYDSIPFSRIDCHTPTTISDNIIPIRMEICGYDVFAFKTEWYKNNSYLFRDFVYATPCFDPIYATVMRLYGNAELGNKDYFCFHPYHENVSHKKSLLFDFNKNQMKTIYSKELDIIDRYFNIILIPNRSRAASNLLVFDKTEINIEKEFWGKYEKNRNNSNWKNR